MCDDPEKEATAKGSQAGELDPTTVTIGLRHVLGLIVFGVTIVFGLWLLRPYTGLNDPLLPSSSAESSKE